MNWLEFSNAIEVESTSLGDVVVMVPELFQDSRGFFSETFRADQFKTLGLPCDFVQDNHSRSALGVVRGLHFQWGSPTLGQWTSIEASAANRRMVCPPAGFARGFCALTDGTEIQYECTAIYHMRTESAILWNDPAIGIKMTDVLVSDKDRKAHTLQQSLASPDSENFQYPNSTELQGSIRERR
jgi:dTDP-4-dehydrorhamnose 3,5-epimerase